MVDLTILEIHLDDASFTATAPFSGEEADEAEAEERADGGDDKPPIAPFLAGLVVLVLIAAAVRKLVRSDEPELPDVEGIEAEE